MIPLDDFGLSYARAASERSMRPVRVGAALLSEETARLVNGWNQLPEGVTDVDGAHSRTVHAEIDAILNGDPDGSTLYVTCPVCHFCAPIVIHAGISRVVTLPPPDGLADWYEASFAAAREMFAEAGVECVEIGDV